MNLLNHIVSHVVLANVLYLDLYEDFKTIFYFLLHYEISVFPILNIYAYVEILSS